MLPMTLQNTFIMSSQDDTILYGQPNGDIEKSIENETDIHKCQNENIDTKSNTFKHTYIAHYINFEIVIQF